MGVGIGLSCSMWEVNLLFFLLGILIKTSSFVVTFTFGFFPSQTSKFSKGSSFFEIYTVSKDLSPQNNSLADSFEREVFVLKPLATAINLLPPSVCKEDAKEYFSTDKKPVFIPSTPIFLY